MRVFLSIAGVLIFVMGLAMGFLGYAQVMWASCIGFVGCLIASWLIDPSVRVSQTFRVDTYLDTRIYEVECFPQLLAKTRSRRRYPNPKRASEPKCLADGSLSYLN